jgi:hypothetical protein
MPRVGDEGSIEAEWDACVTDGVGGVSYIVKWLFMTSPQGSIEAEWDACVADGEGKGGVGGGGGGEMGGGGVGGDADEDGGDGVPLNVVGGAGGGLECRREQLLRYFGERARAGGARGLPHRCCDML